MNSDSPHVPPGLAPLLPAAIKWSPRGNQKILERRAEATSNPAAWDELVSVSRQMTPEVQQKTTEGGWTFSFAPYFWAAGLSGDLEQFGLPAVDVNASFRDIFDHLEFGAMAIGVATAKP